jgi:hypothetical protein
VKWLAEHRGSVFPVSVTLVWRVGLALWGAWTIASSPAPIIPNPPSMYHGLVRVPDDGMWLALAPWQRWDAIWYLRIAQFGYAADDSSTSFFPLYSILTRFVALLTRDYLAAALVVSTLSIIAAFAVMYRLTRDLFDHATAQRAILYWVAFPTAFFLFAPYAESLLVATALTALYFERQKKWGLAAIAAGAATLTRPVGFLIALPLFLDALRAPNWRERVRGSMPLLGVAFGLGVFMLYLQIFLGDALLWVHSEDAWGRIFVFPGTTIFWAAQDILHGRGAVANDVIDIGLTFMTLGITFAAWKKLPFSLSAYALAMIVFPLLSYAQAASYAPAPMAAAGRRVLVAFPAFIALAVVWRGKWKQPSWIATSAALQLILFTAFVKWLWID